MADDNLRLQIDDPAQPKSVRRAIIGAKKLGLGSGGVPEPVADEPPGVRTVGARAGQAWGGSMSAGPNGTPSGAAPSVEPHPTQIGGAPGRTPVPLAPGTSDFRTPGGVNEPKIPVGEVIEGWPANTPRASGVNPSTLIGQNIPQGGTQANPASASPMGTARDFSIHGTGEVPPQPVGQSAEGVRTAGAGGAGAPPGGNPPPPGGPAQRGGVPYEVGRAAGQGVKALRNIGGELLPGAAGYIGTKILNSTDEAKIPPVSPPGAGPASSSNAAQIPVPAPGAGGAPPTQLERQPMGVGGNTEFTRNLANTMNAVAPLAGGASAGLRGAGAAQQLMSAGYGAMAARPEGGDPTGMARPAPQVQQTASSAPPGTGSPNGPGTPAETSGTPTGLQPGATPDTKNVVNYQAGKVPSFSGGNVREGFTYSGAGAPAGAPAGGDFVSGARGEPFDTTGTNLRAAGISNDIVASQGPVGGTDASGGSWRGHTWADDTRSRNEQIDRSNQLDALDRAARLGGSSHERAAARAAYAQLAERGSTLNSAERVAGVREAGETTRANAVNNAALAQHRMTNATAIRGQDIGLQEHQMQLEMQRSIATRQIAQQQREYERVTNQEGVAQANVERAAREEAQQHAEKYAVSNAPVTGNTEQDAAIKTRFITGLNAAFVGQEKEAEARLAKDPNNKQLAQQVEAMHRLGIGSMNEAARRKAIAGIHFNELARQTRGWGGLYGSSPVISPEPATGVTRDKDGNYRSAQGTTIPARFAEKEGAYLGFGGIPSQQFKELIEK